MLVALKKIPFKDFDVEICTKATRSENVKIREQQKSGLGSFTFLEKENRETFDQQNVLVHDGKRKK